LLLPHSNINLLIAIGTEIIRAGMAALVNEHGIIKQTYKAGTAREALEVAQHMKADIVITSNTLPDMPAESFVKQIKDKAHNLSILLLTDDSNARKLHEYMRLGCKGFLSTQSTGSEIVKAITSVLSGEYFFCGETGNAIAVHVLMKQKARLASKHVELTPIMQRTLQDIYDNLNPRQIAEKESVNIKTIERRLFVIYRILGVSGKLQAIKAALKLGLIVDDEIG